LGTEKHVSLLRSEVVLFRHVSINISPRCGEDKCHVGCLIDRAMNLFWIPALILLPNSNVQIVFANQFALGPLHT